MITDTEVTFKLVIRFSDNDEPHKLTIVYTDKYKIIRAFDYTSYNGIIDKWFYYNLEKLGIRLRKIVKDSKLSKDTNKIIQKLLDQIEIDHKTTLQNLADIIDYITSGENDDR